MLRLVKDDEVEGCALKDVEVPQSYLNRITTGSKNFDKFLGGGWVKGGITLLAGAPGSGKSSFALTLADMVEYYNKDINVLYNSTEESLYALKIRANNLGLLQNFEVANITNIDNIFNKCIKNNVKFLIIDSLQTLDNTGRKSIEEIVRKIIKFANANNVAVFIVCHATKSGLFSGTNTILHDVDNYLHFIIDNKTNERFFEFLKNRHGGEVNVKRPFKLK